MRYKNVIMINSKEELEAFKQGVAKTLQIDFGVRWDYGTADAMMNEHLQWHLLV